TVGYSYYAADSANCSAGDLQSVRLPPVIRTPNTNDFPAGKNITYTYSQGYSDDRQNHLLLSITDPKGQTAQAFTYEQNPSSSNFLRCVAEQCGAGNILTYNYAAQTPSPANRYAALKTFVNDPLGNVSEYLYDSRNRLIDLRQYT